MSPRAAFGGRSASVAALSAWFVSVTIVCASLLAGHVLTLPRPDADDRRLRAGIARLAPQPERPWIALHFLYGPCRCSERVLDHLVTRGPRFATRERVVLVEPGPTDAARARAAGFEVEVLTRGALEERYGVRAAPILVVALAHGEVRYVGGYTDRKQSQRVRDLEVMSSVAAGRTVAALPSFGCAVADQLARSVDPFGVRR